MINTFAYIVKKYNIDSGRQYVVEIPNMGRDNLAALFAELKFKKGAEIGVEKGIYSEILLKANPKLHLFSIDPWKAASYEPETRAAFGDQKHFDRCYRMAKGRLSPYNCTIICKESMEAVKNFKDDSLDFVYIDGNHDFTHFTNDLHYWQKKVRTGGIISGHDYAYFHSWQHNHVKHVVLAYTKAYGIRPLFIAGSFAYNKGVVRDRFRSWFWVKS